MTKIKDDFVNVGSEGAGGLPSIHNADAAYVMPKDLQANFLGRFFLKHAGGFDPKYYTKQMATQDAPLALPKFAAAGMATYALSKMGAKIISNLVPDTTIGEGLGAFGALDLQTTLLAGTSLLVLKIMNSLDTVTVKQMRTRKIGQFMAKKNEDVLNWSKTNTLAAIGRSGLIVGGLMITIPAFMVGANSGKIDQIIKDGTNASNDFIYEEFRTDLDEFDAQTRQREGLLASLNAQLLDGGGSISLTPAEEQRQNDLRAQIATLEGDIRDLEGDRSRFDSARTDAQTRMDDEFEGTRGATAGQGPRWRDAKADFDEAERNVTRINSEIAGKRSDMNSIRGEITAIDQSAGARANRERDVANAQSTAIQVQIAGLQAELAQRASDRQDISDVDALAAAHPEFVDPDPDIAEQFSTYVGYLTSEESTTADWLSNIGLLLMLSLLEAGVFLLAAARPVSEGEKNAYRGAVAIDRVQKLHEEFEKVKDKIDKEKLGIEAAKWAAGKEAIEDSIARVKAMEAEKREQMIQFMRDNPEHTNQILQQILHTMAEMQGAENVTDMAENPVYKAFLEAQQETISEAYITEAQDPRVTAFYDALDASTGERPIQIAERSRAVTSLGSSPPRLRTLK